ncbi:hypothetical protein ACPXCE_24545 [Streptomyces sp. DT24]|uniref:hypothetical protein n=1 Tax=Streptomyces sp. DT24 TaxID=3416520 RepID=UPI003CE99C09
MIAARSAEQLGQVGQGPGVRVTALPDCLALVVVNGAGAGMRTGVGAFRTSGHGLPGLAERVRLLHGEIEVGPDGPRHWRLAVRLPVRVPVRVPA